jgi:hypothetical protein
MEIMQSHPTKKEDQDKMISEISHKLLPNDVFNENPNATFYLEIYKKKYLKLLWEMACINCGYLYPPYQINMGLKEKRIENFRVFIISFPVDFENSTTLNVALVKKEGSEQATYFTLEKSLISNKAILTKWDSTLDKSYQDISNFCEKDFLEKIITISTQ